MEARRVDTDTEGVIGSTQEGGRIRSGPEWAFIGGRMNYYRCRDSVSFLEVLVLAVIFIIVMGIIINL